MQTYKVAWFMRGKWRIVHDVPLPGKQAWEIAARIKRDYGRQTRLVEVPLASVQRNYEPTNH